ncbi:hypothetical protein H2203_002065 [Taxawa tesnikishii (nom. ined.)]|nr:hypothetical protein H2203_002065 [Dothideales sp. JES 119]
MAANDYYRDTSNRRRREDAPLPAIPQPSSPFNDTAYPYHHPQSSQSSYSGLHGRNDATDPFVDNGSVPLQDYSSSYNAHKHASQTSTAPMVTEYDDPFIRDAKPKKRRRHRNPEPKKGWFSGRVTWVCYILSVVQLVVFIVEIVKNAVLTKSPIEIHPQFNPMIGPSPYVLINMGARYVPCMHNMPNVQNASTPILWPCPNATSTTGDSVSCSLSDLCGFSGVPNPHIGGSLDDKPYPNQWFRFIVPIFLHAGIIHIGFNLLLQLTLGRDMERSIGSLRFLLVYFSSGIFGFVLGGNFAATGIATPVHLARTSFPVKDLMFILIDVIIAFILGLLPGLDNFSHIGGFLMGLVLGVCLLHSPTALRRRIGEDEPPYTVAPSAPFAPEDTTGLKGFARQPVGFFKGRRPLWWAWWLVRAAALLGALIGFIVLLKNFYVWRNGCSWCKYLSCLPVNNWCSVGNLQFSDSASSGNSTKRGLDLLSLTHEVFRNART